VAHHRRHLRPTLRLDCTAARAAVQALPRNLAGAAQALGLAVEKDDPGRRLMLRMAKPRRVEDDGTFVWWDDEDRRQRLEVYCVRDVEVERALDRKLLPLSQQERKIWRLDFAMNYQRGVQVDLQFVREAKKLVEHSLADYGRELSRLTGGQVTSTTHNSNLRDWLNDNGAPTASVAKDYIAELLEAQGLLDNVRRVLEIRQESAKSSTAKLKRFLSRTDAATGRMCDNLMYCAAGTGRWGGRGVQLQNLLRPTLTGASIHDAVRLVRERDIKLAERAELIGLMYGSVPETISSCLRSAITAPFGGVLHVADYSNIEGRVNAWLAGDQEKCRLFAAGGGDLRAYGRADI
jgi:DNA polymerase